MTAIALLPIELWDNIIRFSVPRPGLGRDTQYPWIDSPRQRKQDGELHRQWSFNISRLSQVCRSWRELLSTIRNQDLRIIRGGRLSLTLLLLEYDRNPNSFRETRQIRIHFPIKEGISSLIAFVQGVESLNALELIIDDGVDVSDVYRPLREHLPAILDATPSLIRLDIEHPLEFDPNVVLSTNMIGRFSNAGRHLRCLSCSLGVDTPYALDDVPSFPHLEILRIAVRCDWRTPIVHQWFKLWELPSLKQLSLQGYTLWTAWEMVLALLADNNIPNLEVFDIGDRGTFTELSLSPFWQSCPNIRILIGTHIATQPLSTNHRMSELVWIETPEEDCTYEGFLQDILRYIQGEIMRVNPPDNHLILRAPELLWGEIRNLSRQRREDIHEIASELNRICQSHNMSLVDGEGQELDVYLSELNRT